MTSVATLRTLLINEVKKRLLEESLPRIKKCLDKLTDEEIWYRPNDNTVSVGNLILHLNGNVRQWILSTFGGYVDTRERSDEFEDHGPIPRVKLIGDLEKTLKETEKILDHIEPEDLARDYPVQGFEEKGMNILIHVTEHFSYHVGQITYYVKSRKDVDMQYYKGIDLDARGSG